MEKLRREKAKTEVLLTERNASDDTKRNLANTNEEDRTKGLQNVIASIGLEPTKIQSVEKIPSHGLRICCPSDEVAENYAN